MRVPLRSEKRRQGRLWHLHISEPAFWECNNKSKSVYNSEHTTL
jgi:hypothetical protein